MIILKKSFCIIFPCSFHYLIFFFDNKIFFFYLFIYWFLSSRMYINIICDIINFIFNNYPKIIDFIVFQYFTFLIFFLFVEMKRILHVNVNDLSKNGLPFLFLFDFPKFFLIETRKGLNCKKWRKTKQDWKESRQEWKNQLPFFYFFQKHNKKWTKFNSKEKNQNKQNK